MVCPAPVKQNSPGCLHRRWGFRRITLLTWILTEMLWRQATPELQSSCSNAIERQAGAFNFDEIEDVFNGSFMERSVAQKKIKRGQISYWKTITCR